MDVSIAIPLFNEEESIQELHDWIVQVVQKESYTYEIIFVDDGSSDRSWEILESMRDKNPNVKAIKFRRNYGKSAGLHVAFEQAMGDVVITMDADLQDSPEEIPALVKMIRDDKFDLVSGWKKKRYDPITKTIPTKLYNGVTSMMSGIKLHDMNCGLKAYRKDVVKSIDVYGEMHRYIPVIAKWAGFQKIGEKVVIHQARKYGVSKFGISRFIYGPLDLLSIMFVSKFGKRPMHFFGAMGGGLILVGLALLMYLSIMKLAYDVVGIANRPAFYLGLLSIIVGVQLFIAGFLGDLISRNAPDKNAYQIEKMLL